jgi:hypothetical protein
MLFVTASDTAVLISASSSKVGSMVAAKAATTVLAKLSFFDLLSNSNIILLVLSILYSYPLSYITFSYITYPK